MNRGTLTGTYILHYVKTYFNKTVLLRERKRHTARHIPSALPAVLRGGGGTHLWLGSTLSGGTPSICYGVFTLRLTPRQIKNGCIGLCQIYSCCTKKDGNTNSHWVMCTCCRYLFWYWSHSPAVWMCHNYYGHWFQVFSRGSTPVLAGRGGGGSIPGQGTSYSG